MQIAVEDITSLVLVRNAADRICSIANGARIGSAGVKFLYDEVAVSSTGAVPTMHLRSCLQGSVYHMKATMIDHRLGY